MPTVTVPRSDVTVEEVTAALRAQLPSRFIITPSRMSTRFGNEVPGDADTILIAGSWWQRANVRVVPGVDETTIEVSPGASYFGLIRLIHRVGLARTVVRALQDAPELGNPL